MRRAVRNVLGVLAVSLVTPVVAAAQEVRVTNTQQAMPLLIVDGVVVGDGATAAQVIARIAPTAIERVEVIKGSAALELYGQRAAGGVIVMRTKANAAANATPLSEEQRQWTEMFKQLRTTEPQRETTRPQPLVVIDGFIVGYGVELGGLDTTLKDRIDRIEVLKGANAVSAYGAAGANGVIIITTK
jgi:TonB-dependent SusC/RagA subfamily outer membrane receptor